jgi:hypothetical protein
MPPNEPKYFKKINLQKKCIKIFSEVKIFTVKEIINMLFAIND